MDRRKFLNRTALAAGAVIWGDALGNTTDMEDMIFGHGDKRYRLNKQWCSADVSRYPVKDCHEMVQDSKGRILLLTNETRNNVLVFDKGGKLLDAWGNDYPGAHGLTLFREGEQDVLFICDNDRHQVIKTDINGRVLLTLDHPKETGMYTKAEEFVPTETAIAANGDIYVVDGYGKDLVIQYDATGRYIRHFGGRGDGDQYLKNAHGICVDTRSGDPILVVTSREQNAFKLFTMDGQYQRTIALPGAWVCRPVIHGDHLYAAVLQSNNKLWQQSGFVTILDKNFSVVSNPAGNAPVYQDGQLQEMYQTVDAFAYPHDVCVDDEGSLYVAQWNSGKVYPYKLDPVR